MTYMRVRWLHHHHDEPVILYSELDEKRWEVRKVDVFRDGRCGYASADEESGGTRLSEVPVPALDEIRADPQFDPSEIAKSEFDAVWSRRRS